MSLYQVQKFLYKLNRDEQIQREFTENKDSILSQYDLTEEEHNALCSGDIGLLYVLGVNGQILMHFAAYLQIEWFDYLQLMRDGISKHGEVRAGIYTMSGADKSHTQTLERAFGDKLA
ncbi:MAG: aromatic ring-opening dioxygenase subunit LigA [Gammaproteobacteria bacterium]|nr:aromatic ring-opening dioxygenase subunit LigA [Gammaproteobacteria bacterium]